MQAVILAAGFSTRLYPLTEFFPKGLLLVGGKPIIEYLLDDLLTVKQVDEIILVSNDRYHSHFAKYLASQPRFARIRLLNDGSSAPDNRRGAIGDLLWLADQGLLNQETLVCPSDTLASLKLSDLLSFYQAKQAFCTVVHDLADKTLVAGRLGCVELNGDKIVGFAEKPAQPKTSLVGVPFYIYPQAILNRLPQYQQTGRSLDAPGSMIEWLLTEHVPAWGYKLVDAGPHHPAYYYDVGTKQVYEELKDGVPQLLAG